MRQPPAWRSMASTLWVNSWKFDVRAITSRSIRATIRLDACRVCYFGDHGERLSFSFKHCGRQSIQDFHWWFTDVSKRRTGKRGDNGNLSRAVVRIPVGFGGSWIGIVSGLWSQDYAEALCSSFFLYLTTTNFGLAARGFPHMLSFTTEILLRLTHSKF